jgi:hypothetical protein
VAEEENKVDNNVLQLVSVQAELPVEFDDPVNTVFQFWKAMMGHPRAQIGPMRRTVIRKALMMGYTADDLRVAVVGCKFSSFHQGANENHETFDDIELICRNEKNIDKFLRAGEQRIRSMISQDQEQRASEGHKPVPMPPAIRAKLEALFANATKRRAT